MKRITQYYEDTIYQCFKLNGETILEVKDPNFHVAIGEDVIIEGVNYHVDNVTIDIVNSTQTVEIKRA